eukprot:1192668-Prorocentrum_minimum.AAC.3
MMRGPGTALPSPPSCVVGSPAPPTMKGVPSEIPDWLWRDWSPSQAYARSSHTIGRDQCANVSRP